MSTIITAAIIIAGTIGIFLVFIVHNNKRAKKRNRALLQAFNQAGAGLQLSFSSQEFLKDKIIGLDGVHRKLLVFDTRQTQPAECISLGEVKACVLKKDYVRINHGNGNNTDFEQVLQSIALQFSFKKREAVFLLPFYESSVHSIYERAELEEKAGYWETLLSKLLVKDPPGTATAKPGHAYLIREHR
jgi:hypothetical protein